MKNRCNKNIGNCYYNKGNHLYPNAYSELELQNIIEMFEKAESYYQNEDDKNDCKNRINQCYAYIYLIYAKREKNIYSQLDYINKAISFWPEKRYGKNEIFYQNKGTFLINKGNEEFQSKNYNNAKNYFTQSYEVFQSIYDFEGCKNAKNGIEICIKIESAMNELFYNNLQEAYNLFLDALDRAKNIKDYVLIKNISFYADDEKKKLMI